MNRKRSTNCWSCSRARGLTLVEVIAAIAILGTVLVGIVLAQARHTRQLTRARAQIEATDAADRLIAGWWSDPASLPVNRDGAIEGDDRLRWQTRLVDNEPIDAMGARVVRVSILDVSDDPQRKDPEGGPLVVVDLVLPDPEAQRREREQSRETAGSGSALPGAGGDRR